MISLLKEQLGETVELEMSKGAEREEEKQKLCLLEP